MDANEQTKARELARLARLREVEIPDDMIDDSEAIDLDDLEEAAKKAEDAGWRRACVAHDVDVGYYLVASRPSVMLKLIKRIRKLERAAGSAAAITLAASVEPARDNFDSLERMLRGVMTACGYDMVAKDGSAVQLDADDDLYTVRFRSAQPPR